MVESPPQQETDVNEPARAIDELAATLHAMESVDSSALAGAVSREASRSADTDACSRGNPRQLPHRNDSRSRPGGGAGRRAESAKALRSTPDLRQPAVESAAASTSSPSSSGTWLWRPMSPQSSPGIASRRWRASTSRIRRAAAIPASPPTTWPLTSSCVRDRTESAASPSTASPWVSPGRTT